MENMLSVIVMAILGGTAGLIVFEIVQEIRGGSGKLQDRYHE
jgi:hypothetical protein